MCLVLLIDFHTSLAYAITFPCWYVCDPSRLCPGSCHSSLNVRFGNLFDRCWNRFVGGDQAVQKAYTIKS